MSSLADITLTEFKSALKPEVVRTGIILQLALAAGVFFFFLAVILISQTQPGGQNGDSDVVEILNMTHAVFFILALFLSNWLFNRQFTPERLEAAHGKSFVSESGHIMASTPAEKLVIVIRTAYIIRTALLEGAAFFGLTTLLVAVQSGLVETNPFLWLNAASGLYQIAFILLTLPTVDTLESLFEERIQRSA